MSLSSCLSIRDLQRLGELQTELAGAADFCATYLRCQLLLIKVGVCVCEIGLLHFDQYLFGKPYVRCFTESWFEFQETGWWFQSKHLDGLTSALFLQALQEKLWNMAVPLCLKQNVTATAAAQQVSSHVCITTPMRSFWVTSVCSNVCGCACRSQRKPTSWSFCTAVWTADRWPRYITFASRPKLCSSS